MFISHEEKSAVAGISVLRDDLPSERFDNVDVESQSVHEWLAREFTKDFLLKRMSDTTTIDGLHKNYSTTPPKIEWPSVSTVIYEAAEDANCWDDIFAVIASASKAGDVKAALLIAKLADEFAARKLSA